MWSYGRHGPSHETFSSYFKNRFALFNSEIDILRQVNKIIPPSTTQYYTNESRRLFAEAMKLDEQGKKQFQKWVDFRPRGKKTRTIYITHKRANELIDTIMNVGMYTTRIPMFIREMSVVYLVASFENFLATAMSLAMTFKPDILKQSDKKLDYREIVAYDTIEGLLSSIINDEVEAVFFKDIEDINGYLKQKFNLNFSKRPDWPKLKEIFYRRNLIIHNDLRPNDIYREKTGYKGKDDRLDITEGYMVRAFRLFERYSNEVDKHFMAKFGRLK